MQIKNLLVTLCLLISSSVAFSGTVINSNENATPRADVNENAVIPADAVVILRSQLGSGIPGYTGLERAMHMGEGIYHAAQYMPAYPTASSLWARVVDVQCVLESTTYVCDGYNWSPAMGRGEYLFFRPHIKPVPPSVEIVKEVPYPVYVEVQKKNQ